MNVLTVPRTAVDRSLRIVRLPIDRVLRGGNDRTAGLAVTVDRADAAVRRLAGQVLRDDVLREDAKRRSLAAAERQRALELRAEAELRTRRADKELADELDSAEKRRSSAAERAQQQQQQAESRGREEIREVDEQAAKKKAASRKRAQRTEKRIEEDAREERLVELEDESEILEAKGDTLTAASEAQRLQRAASEVKERRKSS